MKLIEIRNLIENYSIIEREYPPPTLMEIAGFPHWENVYSNILAFFLDTNQHHGFNDMLLISIINCYNNKFSDTDKIHINDNLETEYVHREAVTKNGKRIDIVIKTSSFILGIENKIYSSLHNDLKEYYEYLEEHIETTKGYQLIPIVLSPNKINDDKIKENKFVNITYPDLVKELKSNIGMYFNKNNTQYQYLLLDFIEQGNKFAQEIKMNEEDKEFLMFWKENEDKLKNINERQQRLSSKMPYLARDFQEQIQKKIEQPYRDFYKIWRFGQVIVVFDLQNISTIDGCGIYLDVIFEPLGVVFDFSKRRGNWPKALLIKIFDNTMEFADDSNKRIRLKETLDPFDADSIDKTVKKTIKLLKTIHQYYKEKNSNK